MSFPRTVLVETTLRCPADCIFCPNKKITGRPVDMPWELFTKIVDECRGKGLVGFHPFINGEPLSSPYLEDALDYISRNLPEVAIHIYTNGYLLDESTTEMLLRYNVREVHFSIDGFSKQVYEQHRRGLVYEGVIDNVRGFLARLESHPEKVGTRVVLTMTPDNEDEVTDFRRFWKEQVDIVDILPCDGRGGEGRLPAFENAQKMGCFQVAECTYILSDGSVVACCKDWAGYTVLGNVTKDSLESIWNSSEYRNLRDDVSRGIFTNYEVCRRCVSDSL
ncbi:MAG: radical SAM protein [Dehalococcoidales bacterium]|nr:MAG: radical SAM protein [Dehalococcoidales bacterium]